MTRVNSAGTEAGVTPFTGLLPEPVCILRVYPTEYCTICEGISVPLRILRDHYAVWKQIRAIGILRGDDKLIGDRSFVEVVYFSHEIAPLAELPDDDLDVDFGRYKDLVYAEDGDYPFRTELVMIHMDERGMNFTFHQKHCEGRYTTASIPISDLVNALGDYNMLPEA